MRIPQRLPTNFGVTQGGNGLLRQFQDVKISRYNRLAFVAALPIKPKGELPANPCRGKSHIQMVVESAIPKLSVREGAVQKAWPCVCQMTKIQDC